MTTTMRRAVLAWLLAAPLVAGGPGGPGEQRRAAAAGFTVEQALSAPFPSQLVAARHGSRAAWVVEARGERNVWSADGPDFVPRQITRYRGDDGQEIAGLQLSPDGWTAVYARGSELNEAGEAANPASGARAPKQQVWAIDVDAGAAGKAEPRLLGDMGCAVEGCEDVQISPDGRSALWPARHKLWLAPLSGATPARALHDLQGDSSQARWSPDGKRIAFRLNRRDHSFVVVYELDGEAVCYMAPSADRDELPSWSPDGKRLAFIREPARGDKLPLIPVRPRPWSLWVADPASGAGREVWHSSREPAGSLPLFAEESLRFAAGDRIVFASEQGAGGRNHLYSIPAGGGEALLLTPGDYDVEDVALSADGRAVLYSANEHAADPADEDRRHLWRVDAAGGPSRQLTRGETIEWSPVETGDGRAVLCLGSTATLPAMPYRVTAAGRSALARDSLPGDFPAARLVVPRQVVFKSADGLAIHGQLFMPPRAAVSKGAGPGAPRLPAIIYTHGGPVRQMLLGFHYMGYYHKAYAMNQYLASQGFVVLSVNYRLGIMYGREFREPPNTVWRGAAEYQDVVAAARFLRGLPEVDGRRIGLWGGSYGGFLTALGLARNSDLFAAGVDLHGVHDWSAFLPEWTEGSPSAAPDAKEAVKLAFESSPDAAVGSWKSPVLLIHGDDDRNVPFSQTRDLVHRLREHGVPFEELVFPDEIHGFLLWRTWVQVYKTSADFFARRLQAPPAAGSAP